MGEDILNITNTDAISSVDCSSINVGSGKFGDDLVKDGVEQFGFGWWGISHHEDQLDIRVQTGKNGPTLQDYTLRIFHHGLLNPTLKVISTDSNDLENISMLRVKYECPAAIDYSFPVQLHLSFRPACTSYYAFSWAKKCGDGVIKPPMALQVSTDKHQFYDHIIYKNGGFVDARLWTTGGIYSLSGDLENKAEMHTPQISLYFRLAKYTNGSSDEQDIEKEAAELARGVKIEMPRLYTADDNLIYPNLFGEIARGENITTEISTLDIIFQCMGIKALAKLRITINMEFHRGFSFPIEKMCNKGSKLDKIEEFVVAEEMKYGYYVKTFLWIILFIFLAYLILVGFNRYVKEMELHEAFQRPFYCFKLCCKNIWRMLFRGRGDVSRAVRYIGPGDVSVTDEGLTGFETKGIVNDESGTYGSTE